MVIPRIGGEEVLRREFGEEWEEYYQNTKRFLPRLIRRKHLNSH
jgi:protein-S-isoprenylcysteine O-methyltransferase Ste14